MEIECVGVLAQGTHMASKTRLLALYVVDYIQRTTLATIVNNFLSQGRQSVSNRLLGLIHSISYSKITAAMVISRGLHVWDSLVYQGEESRYIQ